MKKLTAKQGENVMDLEKRPHPMYKPCGTSMASSSNIVSFAADTEDFEIVSTATGWSVRIPSFDYAAEKKREAEQRKAEQKALVDLRRSATLPGANTQNQRSHQMSAEAYARICKT